MIHSKFCFAGPLSGSLGLCLWSICIRLGISPQNLPRVLNRSVSQGRASLAVRCICIRRGDPGMLQIRDQDRAWDTAFPGCSQGRYIIAPGPEPSSEEQEFRGWGICIVLEPVRAQQHSVFLPLAIQWSFASCYPLSWVPGSRLQDSFTWWASHPTPWCCWWARMSFLWTGANLPSSCLHHCNQREVYLFTSFGWVFSTPYFSQACISYTHSIPVSSPSSQNLLLEKDLISSFI